jgi:hypothetical protein
LALNLIRKQRRGMTPMNADLITELYECAKAHADQSKQATASVLRRAGDALQSCDVTIASRDARIVHLESEQAYFIEELGKLYREAKAKEPST